MKLKLRSLSLSLLVAVLALLLMPTAALAVPVVPLVFEGNVTIGGSLAPPGTIISAEVADEEIATNAPDGISQEGYYRLDVSASKGDLVKLYVGGVFGGEAVNPDPMSTWHVVCDLDIEGAPAALVAEAGGPYSGAEGESIALAGSATGGTLPYTYAWDLDNDGSYETEGATPSKIWDTADTYTIGLQVTDNAAGIATDTATVTVIAEGGFDPNIYDTDGTPGISHDEALAAVNDYLAEPLIITKANALEVVKLYFS